MMAGIACKVALMAYAKIQHCLGHGLWTIDHGGLQMILQNIDPGHQNEYSRDPFDVYGIELPGTQP